MGAACSCSRWMDSEVEESGPVPPLRLTDSTHPKFITLILHGESELRVVQNERSNYVDAVLTNEGDLQATSLTRQLSKLHIDDTEIVLASTMTRSLQTACRIFSDTPTTPIIASHTLCDMELISKNQSQRYLVSRKISTLESSKDFQRVDFSLVQTEYAKDLTNVQSEAKMMSVQDCKTIENIPIYQGLSALFNSRREEFITVVTHSHLIRVLLGPAYPPNQAIPNCSLYHIRLTQYGFQRISHEMFVDAKRIYRLRRAQFTSTAEQSRDLDVCSSTNHPESTKMKGLCILPTRTQFSPPLSTRSQFSSSLSSKACVFEIFVEDEYGRRRSLIGDSQVRRRSTLSLDKRSYRSFTSSVRRSSTFRTGRQEKDP